MSFLRELEIIFPGQKLERIPLTHPVFGSEFGGRGHAERLDTPAAAGTDAARIVLNVLLYSFPQ